MQLNFRAMAALCSVAVSLSSGCESAPADSSSGGISPIFTEGNHGESLIEPYSPTEEDITPAQLADCTIELSAQSAKITGSGAVCDGDTVKIQCGGAYRLSGSGTLPVMIECDEAISLILDGAELNAPIRSTGAAQIMLTLADNSINTVNTNASAGIIGAGDITVNGTGQLNITAENGIYSDGAVKLCGGTVELMAEASGISCGGYVICAGATLGIRSGSDAITTSDSYISITDGSIAITSDGNGLRAPEAVFVSGGETELDCGGGSSAVMFIESGGKYPYGRHGGFFTDGTEEFDFDELSSGDSALPDSKKGISCGGIIRIDNGTVKIDSADDAISSSGNIILNGGELTVSSGDDAFHSDSIINVTSGSINVLNSYTAMEALAVDIGGGELRLSSCRDGIKTAGGNDMSFYHGDNDSSEHYVSISGGNTVIEAGGDGIDAGGTAAMSGGSMTIYSAAGKSFGSLDYSDSFALSGGTLAAFGSDGFTRAPSMVSGVCLSVMAEIPSGAKVRIESGSGDILFSTVLPKACSTVIFSSEELISGEEYRIYADEAEITSLTASQGVCGDGPSSRGGTHDNISNGTGNSSGIVA